MLWPRTQTEQEDFRSSSRENHSMIPGIMWQRLMKKLTMDDKASRRMPEFSQHHYLTEEVNDNNDALVDSI